MHKSTQVILIASLIAIGLALPLMLHSYSTEYFSFKIKYIYFDFHTLLTSIQSLDPYHHDDIKETYFPFSYLIMFPLLYLKKETALMIYIFIFLIGFTFFNWFFLVKKITNKTNIASLMIIGCLCIYTIFTYPAIEALLTANIEIYTFLFLATFLFLYIKKKFKLSTIFLSAAIAMKFYPAIFLLLYLSERQFKELSITFFLSLALIIVSLCCFKSSCIDSIFGYFQNLHWYNHYFVQSSRGITHNTSLFALSHVISQGSNYIPASDSHRWIYFLCSLIFFSLIAFYVVVFETILWKKILLLTCTMLLLPFVMFYYKLIYLYLPFYAFIYDDEKDHQTGLIYFTYLIIFILLLIPKEYFHTGIHTISALLNPLLMLSIMGITIVDNTRNEKL